MKIKNYFFLQYIILTLFLSAMSSSSQAKLPWSLKKIESNFVSVVPQSENLKVVIVELKHPPLLSNIQKSPTGTIIIDENLKTNILLEQDDFKKSLLKVSDKIQIVYTYQLVFNGMTIAIPANKISELEQFDEVQSLQQGDTFSLGTQNVQNNLALNNLATFKNPNKLFELLNIDRDRDRLPKGHRQTVAVIDSGIDFSHKVFHKDSAVWKNLSYQELKKLKTIDYTQFPKIAGGIDLVGDRFFRDSTNKSEYIPQIDFNPLDYNGHGTAISSVINGQGDGVKSVDGLLPEAKIFSIRVLGQSGSIDQHTILKGLEIVADPTMSMNPNHHLNIVNVSIAQSYLGNFGLLKNAVSNLSQLGVSIIGAAANSGNFFSITGGISTLDEVISVGSSSKTDREFVKGTALELSVKDDPKKNIKLIFRDCSLCQKLVKISNDVESSTKSITLL